MPEPTYTSVMDDCMIKQRKQEIKDAKILKKVNQQVSAEQFKNIRYVLEESEHAINYQIVDASVGTLQNEADYKIWINQSCGETGDNYSGTVCMELFIGKYFMWDYWM